MPILSNPKHELFAQELAKGKSAEAAYVAAGFKPNRGNATVLKQKESISNRVSELLDRRDKIDAMGVQKAAEAVAVDKAWVMARLKENAERALQARQATDAEGNPAGDFKYEGAVANRALELLGKEIGMFVDRKEIRTGRIDLARLTDEELSSYLSEAVPMLPRPDETAH